MAYYSMDIYSSPVTVWPGPTMHGMEHGTQAVSTSTVVPA